ncbi:MAG: DUF2334 domain-containing protein [archaeon]|nr:DUF2334 domain-containing protein [archaeon]
MNLILRVDDVGRKNYSKIMPSILEEFSKRDFPCTLGVIACELENKDNYIERLKDMGLTKRNEFALHGYYHQMDENQNPEFKILSKEKAKKLIQKGKNLITKKLDVVPVTFIPPWNESSYGTKEALLEENFLVYSGGKGEFENSKMVSMGYTASTATFGPHKLVPLTKLKNDCEESLKNMGYCVVMIHPQDYLSENFEKNSQPKIDSEKYKNLTEFLDWIKEKGFNPVTFREQFYYLKG